MKIKKVIRQLEHQLNFIKSPLLNLFNSGLTEDEISGQVKNIPLNFPKDFYSIYKWKNGTKLKRGYIGELHLFVSGIFMSLEDSIVYYHESAGTDEYWTPDFFPIFMSGGGQYFLLYLGNDPARYGKLYFYCIDDSDDWLPSVFDNLTSCFETILEWYKTHVLYYNQSVNKILQVNIDKDDGIGRRNNPSSKYWLTNKI